MAEKTQIPQPECKSGAYITSIPSPGVLLVTINRPQAMNCLGMVSHWELNDLFIWFDMEPTLRVAIITGAGPKAFCAGQDLIEQAMFKQNPPHTSMRRHPPNGFAGLSRRLGKKPVVAAVNGFALGGGMEICLNW
jgi:enoyl-CoA hydratase/carnithine racemase